MEPSVDTSAASIWDARFAQHVSSVQLYRLDVVQIDFHALRIHQSPNYRLFMKRGDVDLSIDISPAQFRDLIARLQALADDGA